MAAEEFDAELDADAERSLKRSLVLQEIGAREGISVTDEEVDTGIREAFEREDANERMITTALRTAELRERVRTSLLEERAAKWLIDHAMPDVQEEAAASEEGQGDENA
jgi:FKBP-type peptidyl-prolyl cis-trans isomerase (trigger factor)